MYTVNQCKLLWIKVSAKCMNVKNCEPGIKGETDEQKGIIFKYNTKPQDYGFDSQRMHELINCMQ